MNSNEKAAMGTGYHVDIYQEIPEHKKITQDVHVALLRIKQSYSTDTCLDSSLEDVLEIWNQYNRIVIRSWDMTMNPGVNGTILRFEQYRNGHSLKQSADFRFTLNTRNHAKTLHSNMHRVREELDATLVLNHMHSVRRVSGSTESGSVQLFLAQDSNETAGWLAVADQLFVPITNKWHLRSQSQHAYLEMVQQLNPVYGIEDAIALQRNF